MKFLISLLFLCNILPAYADSVRYDDVDLNCDADINSCKLKFELYYSADDREIASANSGCVAQVMFRYKKDSYISDVSAVKNVTINEGRGNMTVHMYFQAPRLGNKLWDDGELIFLNCQPD